MIDNLYHNFNFLNNKLFSYVQINKFEKKIMINLTKIY